VEPPFPIENRSGFASPEVGRIIESVVSHSSIKHALDWLAEHDPPLTVTDMVTQDEFSHDVLVSYDSGLWLVYDCT
jgi:hypothetical protein